MLWIYVTFCVELRIMLLTFKETISKLSTQIYNLHSAMTKEFVMNFFVILCNCKRMNF